LPGGCHEAGGGPRPAGRDLVDELTGRVPAAQAALILAVDGVARECLAGHEETVLLAADQCCPARMLSCLVDIAHAGPGDHFVGGYGSPAKRLVAR
jgi:hypothetical protein